MSTETLQLLASYTAAHAGALHSTMADGERLAALNRTVLMQTRNSNADVRLAALSCAETMYEKLGAGAVFLMRETAKFVSELFEGKSECTMRAILILFFRR